MLPSLSFSSAAVSGMLKALGRRWGEIAAYMQEDVSRGSRFIFFDGHRLVTSSRTMELAERGYDSKMRCMPQTNLVYVYSLSEGQGTPVYYKQYAGSTPDVTAFSDILRECGIKGSDYTVVAGKGFGSEEDFQLMDDLGLKYIMPLKRRNRFISGRLPSSLGGYRHCFTHHGRAVFSTPFQEEGFTIHLFFDAKLSTDEAADAVARLEKRNSTNARRAELEERRRSQGRGRMTDEQLAELEPQDIAASAGISVMNDLSAAGEGMSVSLEDLNAALRRITASRVGNSWQVAPVKKATRNILNKIGFDIQDENIECLILRTVEK